MSIGASARCVARGWAVVLAPAFWLERTRGRRRLALLALYALIVATAAVLAWRASRLSGIPDIGDPFDTDRLLAWKVPDERNAYVFYRKAHEAIHHDHEVEKTLPGYRGGAYTGQALSARETAYLEANAPALRLWREGTERPEAQYYRMAELNIVTPLDVVHSLRHFARLALLEGSRCESRGDMAGAWGWYRAVLRSSWHCGARGVLVERLIGYALHAVARARILTWAADPRVDATLLRRALADLREVEAMATPTSEAIKAEYLSIKGELANPEHLIELALRDDWGADAGLDGREWTAHLRALRRATWFLQNEPERSKRLWQLAFANILAYCDAPPAERPAMLPIEQPWSKATAAANQAAIFDAPIPTPPGTSGVSPSSLKRKIESAGLARTLMIPAVAVLRTADGARSGRAALVVGVAKELYAREHGRPPESASALVGPYLDRLPEGYVDPEATPGG
jgi:hypothetical protein